MYMADSICQSVTMYLMGTAAVYPLLELELSYYYYPINQHETWNKSSQNTNNEVGILGMVKINLVLA